MSGRQPICARVALLLIALTGIAALGCRREEAITPHEAAHGETPGEPAPDFTLKDLSGRDVDLASLRGKTVLIDFWATWCPPCEFQIPVLNEIYAEHRNDGVEILGVSVDQNGPDVVAAYAQKRGVSYTILLGDEALARDYGAPGFPALVIVAPDGTIHSRHVGLVEKAEIESILAGLLARHRTAAPPGADSSERPGRSTQPL